MADLTGKVKALVSAVRGSFKSQPKQLDGYRQYSREQQAMGDKAAPYEEWVKSAADPGSQYQNR